MRYTCIDRWYRDFPQYVPPPSAKELIEKAGWPKPSKHRNKKSRK